MVMVSKPPQCHRTFVLTVDAGLLGGKVIGLPPVLNFGSEELKAKVVPEVLAGKKFICLAISEAQAGSDVMGLQTTAVKSEDGKEWIINGECQGTHWNQVKLISVVGSKKWITNGTYVVYRIELFIEADYPP